MKKYLIFLGLFLATFLVAQKKAPIDTAQMIMPYRVNAPETYEKPYVILISSDGFRYDYLKKYQTPHLQKLANEGVWAKKGMLPSYPSITFPNHYTLATGMYPGRHGIVDNVFYDPSKDDMYYIGSKAVLDGSWYEGVPIWTLAEQQGLLSACLFWVGSESNAGGKQPTYWYRYHEQFTDDDKIRIIRNWLTMPENERPHLITLYFPEVDKMGHKYGPDAPETQAAVLNLDLAIQKLVDALEPLNLPINFIFVSDHGMIGVDKKDYIPMPEIDKDKFTVVNSRTLARITAKNLGDVLPLYQRLIQDKPKDYKVYLASEFPDRLHYNTQIHKSRRIGDIILVPNESKLLVSSDRPNPPVGNHGFDHKKVPEMKATFIAWGPAFKTKKKVCSFENVHVYPLIAEMLHLQIAHPIDGDIKKLKKILK
ncbi:MAG: ectonucleotide pyrophosphatase/phosphodiesterase [Chitinophagales bacterium]|nr:ectonucleotide pyrophosphatase/phosphodiesterase [Chitinophagales bacterium]